MPAAPVLAAGLAVTSVLLAAPVSALLARAGWTRRAPRAALVLWQAVCLASGLCFTGAGYVLALEPLGNNIFSGLRVLFAHLGHGRALVGMTGHGIITGTLSTTVALILFGVLIHSVILTVQRRRAHRRLLDLLTADRANADRANADRASADSANADRDAGPSDPVDLGSRRWIGDLLADVRVLDHSSAVAYTLPGWHSRVVLSVGLLDLLPRAELIAVIDHERAHVRSRHDLLVLPFQAWGTAVGWLPGVRAAARSVAELTEMLADDWAARRSSPVVLAKALVKVVLAGVSRNSGIVGSQTPAVAGRSVSTRVDRLLHPSPLPAWGLISVYLAAAVLLAVPFVTLVVGWSSSS